MGNEKSAVFTNEFASPGQKTGTSDVVPKTVTGLQFQIVNDKGRYRQHREIGQRLKPFRRCRMRLKFQVDRSPHLEASVCYRCTPRWSAQKRDRAETESVPVRLHNHGTCARLCHLAGGELEQIQFLLGHASVQTTERYLGCKQRLSQAVKDELGLEGT